MESALDQSRAPRKRPTTRPFASTSTVSGMLDAPRDFSSGQCGAESMKWLRVAFDCFSQARALLRSSSVEMPMIVYGAPFSLHARCSREAASLRQGLHQLAQTLMIRGRPLKLVSDRAGPFRPAIRKSGTG